jgi:hypothetical protein
MQNNRRSTFEFSIGNAEIMQKLPLKTVIFIQKVPFILHIAVASKVGAIDAFFISPTHSNGPGPACCNNTFRRSWVSPSKTFPRLESMKCTADGAALFPDRARPAGERACSLAANAVLPVKLAGWVLMLE